MEDDYWERLLRVIRKTFRDPELSVKSTTAFEDVPGWDSIGHLKLVLEVEKEFAIRFEVHEIAGIESLGDLYTHVRTKSQSV